MAISNFLSNPSNIAEIIALIVALLTLSSKKAGYWRLFILYLAITIAVEAAGSYLHFVLEKQNYPLYDLFMIVQALFFAFLFYRFNPTERTKLAITLICGVFFACFMTEGIIKSFQAYNIYSRQLLAVFVIFLSCRFYFSVLKNDGIKSPVSYPPFWIVTGLFFYYFGSVAMFALYDRVSKIKLSGSLSFYTLVIGSLSCILYGSWIIGFVCRNKQVRSFRRS